MNLNLKYKLGIILIKLISFTWRIKITGKELQKPSVIAFWHGEMLPVWKYFSFKHSVAVVSPSRDGEILSWLLISWDYTLIRGSSDKGGSKVLQELSKIETATFILITPDGPRGQIHKFKKGAVIYAYRSGLPLYLCGVRTKMAYYLKKSWDKFCIPLPFSIVHLNFSEPIFIDKNSTREEIENIIKDCEQKLSNL